MRLLLTLTAFVAGALTYRTAHRYLPAVLWWLFSRGDT